MDITRCLAGSITTCSSWARSVFRTGWHIFPRDGILRWNWDRTGIVYALLLTRICDRDGRGHLEGAFQERADGQWRIRISTGAGYALMGAALFWRWAVGI